MSDSDLNKDLPRYKENTKPNDKTTTIFLVNYNDKRNIIVAQFKGDWSEYDGHCIESYEGSGEWKENELTKLLFSDTGLTLNQPEIWEDFIPSHSDPFNISKLSKSDYFIRIEWD